MDLSAYTAELRDSLTAAGSFGDEPVRRAAAALAAALEPAGRLALMHALSDLAAEVTAQLAESDHPVTVDVRVDGRDLRVVTQLQPPRVAPRPEQPTDGATFAATGSPTAPPPDGEGHDRSFAEAGGDLTRTTVRMFNELKARAEKAASEQGVSLNSFISKAVAESIKSELPRKWKDKQDHHRDVPGGGSIKGFVQG